MGARTRACSRRRSSPSGTISGCSVVAEGVETDAQARFLRRAGCDEVQGFFYGEAVAPAQHAALLARTAARKRA
jgi:EAL domain-containing protein (putative c-di-GMP-specific phosphodiesterase class I)